jgi:hypothetical protein
MTPSENIEYFNKAIDSTPEGKDFSRWFDFSPVRTGRFYIKLKRTSDNNGIYIPSKSYFSPLESGSGWYYEFTSSSGTYGHKRGDLKDLFREFMIDAVRKSRPSTIKQSKIEEYFSYPSNSPKGKFEIPEEIYSKILKGQGLITDFSFLRDLPFIKNLDPFVTYSTKDYINFNFHWRPVILYFLEISNNNKGKKDIYEFLSSFGLGISNSKESLWSSGTTEIEFKPGASKGKKTSTLRGILRVSIGSESQEKISEIVEGELNKFIEKIGFYIVERQGPSTDLNFIKEYIQDLALGRKKDSRKEIRDKLEDVLYEIVSKKIQEGNIIDSMEGLEYYPEIKERILKNLEIPDPSKIAKLHKMGWFGK